MSTIKQRIIERLDGRIERLVEVQKLLAEIKLEDRYLNKVVYRYSSMRARMANQTPQPKGEGQNGN